MLPAAAAVAVSVAAWVMLMTASASRRLRHVYPDGHVALDGIDLTVAAGERVAVLGPNGAGKTTLMLHLNGVLTATTGSVQIGGIPLERKTLRDIRRRVGLVFQDPDDQLFMPTVAQDVAFGPANFGVRGEELAARVRDAPGSGIADRARRSQPRAPVRRSTPTGRVGHRAGLRARHSGARRTVGQPRPGGPARTRRDAAGLDTTMLMVTHDLPYAAQLCDRAVIMDGGSGRRRRDRRHPSDTELLGAHRLELPWGFAVSNRRRPRAHKSQPFQRIVELLERDLLALAFRVAFW